LTHLARVAGTRGYPLSQEDGEALMGYLRDYPGSGDLVMRLSVRSSDVSSVMESVALEAESFGLQAGVIAHAANGTILARVDGVIPEAIGDLVSACRRTATARGGRAIVLRAPSAAAGQYDPWGFPGTELNRMMGIKSAIDRQKVLSPGR